MPFETWQVNRPNQGLTTAKAFVFDGWSHEPLVIDTTRTVHSLPPTQAPQAIETFAPANQSVSAIT
jgi:hypothetical protein